MQELVIDLGGVVLNQEKKGVLKPKWLKTDIPKGEYYFKIKRDLRARKLTTVCEEAKCPNIAYCWGERTATFMLLGDTCTRACRFCHIKTGNPAGLLNQKEPMEVAKSCQFMALDYVVLTMVDRDDIPDGGAYHVVKVIKQIQELNPGIKVEILAGDFGGKRSSLKQLVLSGIQVFAHNIETVKRLSPRVRDARASYQQSLSVLKTVKEEFESNQMYSKSALMLGLGETKEEVIEALGDLREHGVDFITIGQYMRPTKKHLSVKEWVKPEVFQELEKIAKKMGFIAVASSPLVRSSYKASSFYKQALGLAT